MTTAVMPEQSTCIDGHPCAVLPELRQMELLNELMIEDDSHDPMLLTL